MAFLLRRYSIKAILIVSGSIGSVIHVWNWICQKYAQKSIHLKSIFYIPDMP